VVLVDLGTLHNLNITVGRVRWRGSHLNVTLGRVAAPDITHRRCDIVQQNI